MIPFKLYDLVVEWHLLQFHNNEWIEIDYFAPGA